jgi:hypothetical protein
MARTIAEVVLVWTGVAVPAALLLGRWIGQNAEPRPALAPVRSSRQAA